MKIFDDKEYLKKVKVNIFFMVNATEVYLNMKYIHVHPNLFVQILLALFDLIIIIYRQNPPRAYNQSHPLDRDLAFSASADQLVMGGRIK